MSTKMSKKAKCLVTPKDVAAWALGELNVSTPYVLDYEANGNIYFFDRRKAPERIVPGSELYSKIREIEQARNITIYAVTHDYLEPVGEMYSYFCISPYEEDFDHMVRHLGDDHFMVYAYVQNMTDDRCSEFGYILVHAAYGGMVRLG